jgi:hypothetical protein
MKKQLYIFAVWFCLFLPLVVVSQVKSAEKGKPINVYTNKIDWIMGSGDHSRVYLYRTEVGELYQLPLARYTNGWGLHISG